MLKPRISLLLILMFTPWSTAMADVAVPVVSGGVGAEDEARLEEVQHNFDLKITFANASGEYLSDVNYSIARKNGDVMARGSTDGPILLTQLPPGSYKVNAQFNGQDKSQDVIIGSEKLHSITVAFAAAS